MALRFDIPGPRISDVYVALLVLIMGASFMLGISGFVRGVDHSFAIAFATLLLGTGLAFTVMVILGHLTVTATKAPEPHGLVAIYGYASNGILIAKAGALVIPFLWPQYVTALGLMLLIGVLVGMEWEERRRRNDPALVAPTWRRFVWSLLTWVSVGWSLGFLVASVLPAVSHQIGMALGAFVGTSAYLGRAHGLLLWLPSPAPKP